LFPAFVVLGLGMSVAVAPLTTTVMGAVSRQHSGVASGVNNAISEAAGLLTVAVFGLAMSAAFDRGLDRRLTESKVAPQVREEIRSQESKLAAIEIAPRIAAAQRTTLTQAINESFVDGFRLVMALGAALALLSAVCAWATLSSKRPQPARREHG
jgi:hypothetical protein